MTSKLTSLGTAAFAMLMVCTCAAAADDKAVFHVENGTIIVSSPFDLEIGSTEYAKIAGDAIRVHRYANYDPDTKATVTNVSAFIEAMLAEPYFGCRNVALNFSGEEMQLSNIHLRWGSGQRGGDKEKPKMTNRECRDLVDRIVEDVKTRANMTVRISEDRSEDDALNSIEEISKRDKKPNHHYLMTFYSWRATCQRNGVDYDYWLNAMIDGKMNREVSLSAFKTLRTEDFLSIPVVTNRSSRFSGVLGPTAAEKKAHDEAAKLRKTLKRLFDVDFDATNKVFDLQSANWSSLTNFAMAQQKKEWTPLDEPFEGMTEKRVSNPVVFKSIPSRTLVLRRPYDGDVEEETLKEQAERLLRRLERELGEKIQPKENETMKRLAGLIGDGIPTFGDTWMYMGMQTPMFFSGQIGDISIDISYASPRYAKRHGKYSIMCKGAVVATIVQSPTRSRPQSVESAVKATQWTKGRITDELPFAVEYKRAKTLCAEYDKRLLFKSGKRVGLLIDTCGYGPFRVYQLKDGCYCLVDGYGLANNPRYVRVNTQNETVELKHEGGWFPIPEKGYVRGWGGVSNDLAGFSFNMYSGESLDDKGWHVNVKGTPVGDSLDGMRLVGEIDTTGKFTKEDQ